MKLVISGDWHLARRAWASVPAVQGDAYRSAEQIFLHCRLLKEKGEDVALILAGDVFDTIAPPPDAVSCFLYGIDRLRDMRIPVLAIQGQHGRNDELPWPAIHPHVINIGAPVAIKNYRIWPSQPFAIAGYDIAAPDVLQEALKKVPKETELLIFHQMLRGLVPDIEGHQSWDLDPEWVPAHVRHVFLGDYHKPIQLTSTSGSEFAYTGSISMQSVDEPPEKSFIEFDVIKRTWQRIPLKTRAFRELTCYHQENLEQVLAHLAKYEPETLVLLKYDPRVPDVEKKAREANAAVHIMPRVVPVHDVVEGEIDIDALKHVTLEGCLDLVVDRVADPEFHSFVLSLLRSKNHKETVTGLRAKYVEAERKA